MMSKLIIIFGILGVANLALYLATDKFKRYTGIFARVFVGLVFIMSGFVKGVDPLGTAYKIEDYFELYKMAWAVPMSFGLSVLLCALEFSVGLLLVLNIKTKYNSLVVALMMLGFTCVTFFDAISGKMIDCGCFGEAIKLTAWETFIKNIVLDIFIAVILIYRKKYTSILKNRSELIAITLIYIGFCSFSIYNYRHLPMVDFTPWKAGTKLYSDKPEPVKVFISYKNKKTGEVKEFLSPNYPFNDSVWMSQWEYLTNRVIDPNIYINLKIEGKDGNDNTDRFIKNTEYQFFITSYDINKANVEGMKKMDKLFKRLDSSNYSTVVLSSGKFDDFERFKKNNKLTGYIEFYNTDDVQLKTMVRSNPGLLLIKNGVVLKKWHYNDIPTLEEMKKLLPKLDEKYLKKKHWILTATH